LTSASTASFSRRSTTRSSTASTPSRFGAQGFEGKDFADYWTPFGTSGEATLVATAFERGEHSVRLAARAGTAGIRQGRVYVEAGQKYDGSLWLHPERGTPASATIKVVT
jgi:alpha-N-arabinofuranosidase